MRAALISLHVEPGVPQSNLRRSQSLIARAMTSGPDVVCFPEMAVVSDSYPHGRFRHLAEPIPGKYSDRFAEWAQAHGVYIIVGLMERADEGFYSSAILIDPAGRVLLKHRQMHNAGAYVAGDRFACTDTPLGRITIAICGDMFESRFHEYVDTMRPHYVFVPMDWCGEDEERGLVNDEVPPRFLGEWKDRFREVSIRAGATVYAVNAYTPDSETESGSCGGAFVFSNGDEIIPKDVPQGCWRQPADSPVCVV